MKRVPRNLAGAMAGCVAITAFAGVAVADSPSLTAAIKHQDKVVGSSATVAQLRSIQNAKGKAGAKKLITPLRKLATVFDSAATAVSTATTTSSTQKTAQRDWVDGVRMEARGLRQIDDGLALYVARGKAAARHDLLAGQRTILAGDKVRVSGDRLLKLPVKD